MTSSGFVIGLLAAMSVFLTVITALIVWFTRKGYNWARIVLGAMGVYIVVNLLFSLFGSTDPAWATVPLVISGVAALGATVLLMRGRLGEVLPTYGGGAQAPARAAGRTALPVRPESLRPESLRNRSLRAEPVRPESVRPQPVSGTA